MSEGALVIGYGNALRTDDGLGWHVAARLRDDPRLAGATVLQRHQLTPELAVDISRATFVVFVDAGTGPPGEVAVQPVVEAVEATLTWSHRADPPVLLALARELYGHAPSAATVSVGPESMELGEGLTSRIDGAVPDVIDAVLRLIREQARTEPARA